MIASAAFVERPSQSLESRGRKREPGFGKIAWNGQLHGRSCVVTINEQGRARDQPILVVLLVMLAALAELLIGVGVLVLLLVLPIWRFGRWRTKSTPSCPCFAASCSPPSWPALPFVSDPVGHSRALLPSAEEGTALSTSCCLRAQSTGSSSMRHFSRSPLHAI